METLTRPWGFDLRPWINWVQAGGWLNILAAGFVAVILLAAFYYVRDSRGGNR